jgi:lipid A 3-O-deacylase
MSRARLMPATVLIAIFLLLVPIAAHAQSASFFDAQQWELGVWGAEAVGKGGGHDFGSAQITMAGFHLGRVIYQTPSDAAHQGTLEYAVNLQPLLLMTQPQRVYGGGLAPVGVKWNFAARRRYRPYLEFNGGGMFTQKNVPPGRTSAFNFTMATGPGVMIGLRTNQAMSVAVRYWHLSNANLGDKNPALNTIQIEVGYHWLIRNKTPQRQVVNPRPGQGASTIAP